jgi:hypothetical protein
LKTKTTHCCGTTALRTGFRHFQQKQAQLNSVVHFLSIPKLTQKTGYKSTTLTEKIGPTEENEYQAIQSKTLKKVVDFKERTRDLFLENKNLALLRNHSLQRWFQSFSTKNKLSSILWHIFYQNSNSLEKQEISRQL